jgi:hypothetical protein
LYELSLSILVASDDTVPAADRLNIELGGLGGNQFTTGLSDPFSSMDRVSVVCIPQSSNHAAVRRGSFLSLFNYVVDCLGDFAIDVLDDLLNEQLSVNGVTRKFLNIRNVGTAGAHRHSNQQRRNYTRTHSPPPLRSAEAPTAGAIASIEYYSTSAGNAECLKVMTIRPKVACGQHVEVSH